MRGPGGNISVIGYVSSIECCGMSIQRMMADINADSEQSIHLVEFPAETAILSVLQAGKFVSSSLPTSRWIAGLC